MSFVAPTSSVDSITSRCRAFAIALCVLLAAVGLAGTARAQFAAPVGAAPDAEPPVFSASSPVGELVYQSGRGFRFGDTGLTIGGFTTIEIDDEEHGNATVELDSVNFLILYEPIAPLRFFAEIEVGGLAVWEPERDDFDSDADFVVERLYGDWSHSDALNLRIGKFQTPVGRWNLVPAEPFVWTAVEPVQLDLGFDEHQTGVAAFGTFYPGDNPLRYWIYGQVVDAFDVDSEDEPADRSGGGRLEYGSALGDWSVGGSLLAFERKGEWQYLAGLDAQLELGPLLLQSEAIFSEGGIPDRDLWSVYVQGVYDLGVHHRLLHRLHVVVRFEHFDPDGRPEDANVWDVGLYWMPRPWLNFKAGYRFSDRVTDDVIEGVTASISVLF